MINSASISENISGEKPLFFLESCEYKKHFLHYSPHDVLITNIDFDHPDAFANETEYRQAYQEFIQLMPATGLLIVSPEEDLQLQKPAGVQSITYSMTFRSADYFGERISSNPREFEISYQGQSLGIFTLNIP
jgi:UDP-N-acetylmuramate--alanine ligase